MVQFFILNWLINPSCFFYLGISKGFQLRKLSLKDKKFPIEFKTICGISQMSAEDGPSCNTWKAKKPVTTITIPNLQMTWFEKLSKNISQWPKKDGQSIWAPTLPKTWWWRKDLWKTEKIGRTSNVWSYMGKKRNGRNIQWLKFRQALLFELADL